VASRIILSAEIDCLEVETRSDSRYDSSAPKRAQKELYVELKTTKQVLSDKDDYNFRRFVFGVLLVAHLEDDRPYFACCAATNC
jgi:hypothetical protein